LDHLVGAGEQLFRNAKAERLNGLESDVRISLAAGPGVRSIRKVSVLSASLSEYVPNHHASLHRSFVFLCGSFPAIVRVNGHHPSLAKIA
jgi:hypothetical protein